MNILCVMPLNDEEKSKVSSVVDDKINFNQNPSDEEFSSAEVIIGNPKPVKLSICENLKWIQTNSAGVNDYIGKMPDGAIISNATGGYGLAISEHLLAMYLELIKKLNQYKELQNDCKWSDLGPVTSVFGATVVVVGMGDIGGNFAKLCKAMGAYVIGVRRTDLSPSPYADEICLQKDLVNVLPKADCVAMALPETPDTINLINKETLSLMKSSAVLLNVGRGSAINQKDLIDALDNDVIFGAGLDVTTPEPLEETNPLWKAKNIVITPHISGGFHLAATKERIINIICENLVHYKNGESIKNEVDFSTGYRKLK